MCTLFVPSSQMRKWRVSDLPNVTWPFSHGSLPGALFYTTAELQWEDHWSNQMGTTANCRQQHHL